MNNPYYDMTKEETQIKVLEGWIKEDEDGDMAYFFRQIKNNLNLLRFYKRKFGKVSFEEYTKFMEENDENAKTPAR